MDKEFKLTEVTDIITPEEETVPKNYNFSMESVWAEEIYTPGGGEAEGTVDITSNGTHDVAQYAEAQVNVPNSYSESDEGKVVSNGALTAQTSRQITTNGTVDTTLNDEVVVNVPTVSIDDFASGRFPSGDITINVTPLKNSFVCRQNIGTVTCNASRLASGCFSESKITKFFCLTNIQSYSAESAFRQCTSLKTVIMPNTTWLDNNIFYGCSALEVADCGATGIHRGGVFQNCKKLSTLILRSPAVCGLSNTSNLSNSPFTGYDGGVGTLYVPSALVESYKTATNWSTLYTNGTMQVLPIEGSIYENAYGDGTPIE